jgi:outer membrane protein insertion porin family
MGGRELPVFKNFKAGGLGSVRAFATDSLGPVDMSGQLVGGTRKLNFNSELYLPVPGSGNDKSLRIFLFGDAGYVWGHYEPVRLKDLRASAGLGVSWMSPMGPLRLSYGTPVRSLAGDRIERLQFQVGNVF